MAKDKEEVIVDVEEVYSKTESWVLENQKSLSIIVGAVVLLLASYFAYSNFYLQPKEDEARDQIWQAQQAFSADNLEVAINGSDVAYGFLDIIDRYGMTEAANLAHYYTGISYLRLGQYENAISYLTEYDCRDVMVCAVALGATGDAYIELGQVDQALSFYESAIDHTVNDFTTPIYLMKAARAHEALSEYDRALSYYERIKSDFPTSNEAQTIDKFIARAKGLAAK